MNLSGSQDLRKWSSYICIPMLRLLRKAHYFVCRSNQKCFVDNGHELEIRMGLFIDFHPVKTFLWHGAYLFLMVQWGTNIYIFLYLSYFLPFIEPCVFIGLHSFYSPILPFGSKVNPLHRFTRDCPVIPHFSQQNCSIFQPPTHSAPVNLSKCFALLYAPLPFLLWPSYRFPVFQLLLSQWVDHNKKTTTTYRNEDRGGV